MPTVSVLLPVYNTERYVSEAIESILVQSHHNLELVIIDDGSTDGTLPILEWFAQRDARVRLSSRSNRGILETRNELLALARGEFVAIMDADDIATPQRISVQYEYMINHVDCVGVGGFAQAIDEGGQPISIWSLPLLFDEIDAANLASRQAIVHSAFFARREIMMSVGGYRRELSEDLDLCLRLAEIGSLANIPEILVKVRRHHDSTIHTHPARLLEITSETIEDARCRRGLPPLEYDEVRTVPHPCPAANHRSWAWTALGAGNLATARKHALAALRLDPFAMNSWRVAYCVLRGH